MNAMIAFCIVPLIFYIIAFNMSDKGKSPWLLFALGVAFVVVASVLTIPSVGIGPQHVAATIITAVFAVVFAKKK